MYLKIILLLLLSSFIYANDFFTVLLDSSYKAKVDSWDVEFVPGEKGKLFRYEFTEYYNVEVDLSKTNNAYYKNGILKFKSISSYQNNPAAEGYSYGSIKINSDYNDGSGMAYHLYDLSNSDVEMKLNKHFLITEAPGCCAGPSYSSFYNIITGELIFRIQNNVFEIESNDFTYYFGFYDFEGYNRAFENEIEYHIGDIYLSTPNRKIQKIEVIERDVQDRPLSQYPLIKKIDNYFIFLEDFRHDTLFVLNFDERTNRILIEETKDNFEFKMIDIEWDDSYLNNDKFQNIDTNLSKTELRILRNTIFARHGHSFKSKDLNKYFLSKDWYEKNKMKKIRTEDFTTKEKEVFEYIIKLENK